VRMFVLVCACVCVRMCVLVCACVCVCVFDRQLRVSVTFLSESDFCFDSAEGVECFSFN
jgi:hypothetical protein